MKVKHGALLLILFSTSVSLAKPQTKDPPGTTIYMAQFRAWFAAADTNKDGILDKEELAHAFRGPFAKPYDYVPPHRENKDKDKGKKKAAQMPHADEEDNGEKDESGKEKVEKDKPDMDSKSQAEKDSTSKNKPARKPDYSRYADYNFLIQLDSDNDEQISREEFESWARDLSVQMKQQADAQQRALELQARLQRDAAKLKPADRRRVENDLRKERERMERFQAQVNRLQQNYLQAQRRAEETRKGH
jgi:hypothetical protein